MSSNPPQFGRAALVARLSLWFAAIAGLGAVAAITLAAATLDTGSGPRLLVDRAQLPLLVAIGACAIGAGIAVSTWLITLHGSLRVAGPLHRFCLALEEAMRTGRMSELRLRGGDLATREARMLEQGAADLYRHYDELAAALESAALGMRRGASGGECPGERVHRLIDRVRL